MGVSNDTSRGVVECNLGSRVGVMTRRNWARFADMRQDLVAGFVLGIESVPDGLASGLLAGVNPLAGVYGYMVGTVAGGLTTSSAFMAVQGTGHGHPGCRRVGRARRRRSRSGPVHLGHDDRGGHVGGWSPQARDRAAFRVERRHGGLHQHGGGQHRPRAVGQPHRLQFTEGVSPTHTHWIRSCARAGCTDNPWQSAWPDTIALILLLERTPVGSLGLVVAVVLTSAVAKALGWDVATVHDLGATLGMLPRPQAAGVEPGAIPARAGAVVGVGGLGAGGRHLGQLPQPGWQLPDSVAGLCGTGRRQPCIRGPARDAGGWVGVRLVTRPGSGCPARGPRWSSPAW